MGEKIWVFGDAVVDLLSGSKDRLLRCPGDASANAVVGVVRFDGDSGFINRVGDDPFGCLIRHTLAQEQVDVNYMRLDAAWHTSTMVIDLDQHGERTFTFMVRPSADLLLQPEDLPSFAVGQWLHVCSVAPSAKPGCSTALAAIEAMRRAGGYVSLDPSVRSNLWQGPQDLRDCPDRTLTPVDAIKLSEEEPVLVSDSNNIASDTAQLNARFQPTLLLVIQGKAGIQAVLCGQVSYSPACPVVAVDTADAGNAFVIGLFVNLATHGVPGSLVALVPNLTLVQTCDTLATAVKGAMTALPHRDDLQRPL